MGTSVLLCDSSDGLAQLQYVLLRSGAALEIETATDGLRAVEVAARMRPDLVVATPEVEGLAGAELVRRLLAGAPGAKVICLGPSEPAQAAEMLQAGASAYVSNEEGPDGVFRAMRAVHAGPVAITPELAGALADLLLRESRQLAGLEASLAELSHRTEALTTAKADFLANVSHELRTPVTIAKGIAHVLRKHGLSEDEQREFVDQLEGALDKLSMLIDEMLTVADLDRGALELDPTDTDVAPILGQVADEIARQYPDVRIERQIPDDLLAAADPQRFAEIVRQLLDNACRYSPPGGPVLLRARSMDEGVVVSVTDQGEGMSRETASKAFEEPFSAGEEILRKERAGAGVGLHMARQLVIQHGGILWADPIPAGGTRVSFVLPARRGEQASRPLDLGLDPFEELRRLAQPSSTPSSS